MERSPEELGATARQVYDRAKLSHTPLSVLSQENRNLSRESGWDLEDVERVTEQVMEMLIRHGWKRQPDRNDG